MQVFLFFLGLIFGSFLNVIATRYDENKFLITRSTLGGRSHCSFCGKTLAWYELIPVVSFLVQKGKCGSCGGRLSFQYPISELIAGAIFALIPMRSFSLGFFLDPGKLMVLSVLWVAVFAVLLLISLIDFRLTIIPDELSGALVILGLCISFFSRETFGLATGSFLGPYALLFGFRDSFFINRVVGLAFALIFFGLIILVTRGRGMGLGDLKLAGALAVVFGWPEIIALIMVAFVVGSAVGMYLIARRVKGIKSLVPFGPFLALATFIVFLWGEGIIHWYFGFFSQ